jgi:hypothetical protein
MGALSLVAVLRAVVDHAWGLVAVATVLGAVAVCIRIYFRSIADRIDILDEALVLRQGSQELRIDRDTVVSSKQSFLVPEVITVYLDAGRSIRFVPKLRFAPFGPHPTQELLRKWCHGTVRARQ